MKACGKVHKYGDNVDTDVIIPARYLNTPDMQELAQHCMEDIDVDFAKNVQKGDIMVAKSNFGCGSSREHAPAAIKASGISCVIAKTFARIFYRNAINIGLPIIECEEAAEKIDNGDEVKLIPANIYASIKDRPADSRCELLTVIEGAHAGEKALYIDGRIRVASGSAWADEINDNDNSIVMFKQQIGSRPRLIICGGGHVSAALVRMASLLAFDIWVIEDRPLFADNAKRQGADHVICGDYKKTLATLEPQADDYYVCMTRGHRFDMECLTEIFRKPYAYVGMMGSKKRAVIVKKDLEELGLSQEIISGLHSPIGLAIGGQTPEEIALSVISEIVKCKNERTSCTQIDNEVLDALIEAAKQHVSDTQEADAQKADAQEADTHYQNEKYILCTIIKKNGSAPRGVGTQMLVSSDNRIVGTIGGGCAEAEVISHCRRLFRKQEFKCELIDVSMNTDDAEKEGMVCGGSISVLLEQAPISAADSNANAACNSEGTEQLRKERLKA